jgi:hypothetical protein
MTTLLPQGTSSLFLEGERHVNDYDVPLKGDHGLIDQDVKTEHRCSLTSDEVPPSLKRRYKNMLQTAHVTKNHMSGMHPIPSASDDVSSSLALGQNQHDHDMSVKLAESTPAQSSRIRRKLEMAAVLKRLATSLQQVVKHGETSDTDDSFYCDDDGLDDSIHLAKKRYGSRKNSLCSSSWEAKSAETLLKDTNALVSPRSLPSGNHLRSTRGAMAA